MEGSGFYWSVMLGCWDAGILGCTVLEFKNGVFVVESLAVQTE